MGAGAAFKDGGSPGAPSRNAYARPGAEKSRAGRRPRPRPRPRLRFAAAALPVWAGVGSSPRSPRAAGAACGAGDRRAAARRREPASALRGGRRRRQLPPQGDREPPRRCRSLLLFPAGTRPLALGVPPGAMAEPGAVAGLEELLTCPICLGIYRAPVSLVCGHSFCEACVQEARSRRPCPFTCPVCSAWADPARELQPNVQLRSIVQKFLEAPARQEEGEREGRREEEGENSGQRDKVIPCDFCLQGPQPAVKTCLSCEASLCRAHLSKHSTKSLLKDHVLIEPCDAHLLAERRCPQHGKLLESYCRTDSVCICVLCSVASPHRKHKIDALEEAFGQAQVRGCQDSSPGTHCARKTAGVCGVESCPQHRDETSL